MPDSWSPPSPMLAVLGQPPVGAGWAFEMKWDGQRAIAAACEDKCRMFSRNNNDITVTFPELPTAVLDALRGRNAVVDGEIVALDSKGRPSFSRLQRRMHVQKPTTVLREGFPVVFYVFDVLKVDGESTTALPYVDRRATLDSLLETGPRIQIPPYWTDVDGRQMLDIAREHGLEGIVAKRTDSTYLPGRRSPTWTKTPLRNNTEVVPIGWVDGAGTASGGIGGLLLGAHGPDGSLVYIGRVGTGFSAADRRDLREQLTRIERPTSPLATAPPARETRGAHWCEPVLVGDVTYREYTGGRLRHPSWLGLRDDKEPTDVNLPGQH